MADILPFRKTGNGLKNDERLIQYLKALIEGKDPGDLIHHVNGKVLCLSVTKIDRSYEEMKLKFFSEGNLMTAPALSSMICLTPAASGMRSRLSPPLRCRCGRPSLTSNASSPPIAGALLTTSARPITTSPRSCSN